MSKKSNHSMPNVFSLFLNGCIIIFLFLLLTITFNYNQNFKKARIFFDGKLEYSMIKDTSYSPTITSSYYSQKESFKMICKNNKAVYVTKEIYTSKKIGIDSLPFFSFEFKSGKEYLYTGKKEKTLLSFISTSWVHILFNILLFGGFLKIIIQLYYKLFVQYIMIDFKPTSKNKKPINNSIKLISHTTKRIKPVIFGLILSLSIICAIFYQIYKHPNISSFLVNLIVLITLITSMIIPLLLLKGITKFKEGESSLKFIVEFIISSILTINLIITLYKLVKSDDEINLMNILFYYIKNFLGLFS